MPHPAPRGRVCPSRDPSRPMYDTEHTRESDIDIVSTRKSMARRPALARGMEARFCFADDGPVEDRLPVYRLIPVPLPAHFLTPSSEYSGTTVGGYPCFSIVVRSCYDLLRNRKAKCPVRLLAPERPSDCSVIWQENPMRNLILTALFGAALGVVPAHAEIVIKLRPPISIREHRTPRPSRNHVWEIGYRSEEHTSELQSPCNLVCRLLLEKN